MLKPPVILAVLITLAVPAGLGLHVLNKRAAKPRSDSASSGPSTATSAPKDELGPWAMRLAESRGLRFQKPPQFQVVNRDRIAEYAKTSLRELYPGDCFERLSWAYRFLGFLEPDVEMERMLMSAASPSLDCAYNVNNQTILHTSPVSSEPYRRELMAQQVLLALIDERQGLGELSLLPEVQLDQSLARRAFLMGDVAYHAAKFVRGANSATTPLPEILEYFARVPQPVQDELLFGYREGMTFCRVVSAEKVSLDSVYQQLPTCSSHILHPELYLRRPRYQPRAIKWPKLDLLGAEPRWDNVAGELMIRGLLRKVLPNNEADPIAAEWDGDRQLFYIVESGPQLAWKTLWRSEAAAARFFGALRTSAVSIFGVEKSDLAKETPSSIEYGGKFALQLEQTGDSVQLIRSMSPEWSATLASLMQEASAVKLP